MVQYDHTAYGKVTVLKDTDGIANINPFRYKGYYYDQESGMYYCHTRYYVPEWGRWLNADNPGYLQSYTITSGLNLFIYCKNNPIAFSDPDGTFVSAIFGALSAVVSGLVLGQSVGQIIYNACVGFALGLIVDAVSVATCGVGTVFAAAAVVGVGSFIADVGSQMLFEDKNFGEVDWVRSAVVGGISAVTSLIGIGVGKALPVSSLGKMLCDIPSWSAGIVYSFGIGLSMNLLTGSEMFNFKQEQEDTKLQQIGDYIPKYPMI